MDPSSAQSHHQEMGSSQTLESMLVCTKPPHQLADQTKKPMKAGSEQALSCPRCDSTNTKFCYYNNYSHSQPRYFCKSCRRYWTKGGTLRNVPVGGGCRRNSRRPSSSPSISSSSKRSREDQQVHVAIIPSPNVHSFSPFDSYYSEGFPISGNDPNMPFSSNLGYGLKGSGFLETPIRGFDNLGLMGIDGISGVGVKSGRTSQEMGYEEYLRGSYAFTTNTVLPGVDVIMKQEMMCSSDNGEEGERSGRGLWGYLPWPSINGGNGIGSSNWHGGLLNSPFM